ncbi:DUF2336 domain-containing protein [Methylobacterium dankookense]|uniref:Uncharacterized protein n=1 Tax=Methylobacterium dankookense TaxID=560405 RepID=A0A564G1Y1_9HYPH|nr:DUF2336 domain-containing protein [Methylobacterium dankookense]GJD59576.1 hypothetical protein IFDJLNFL_5505 [Methylobacterium dankookense]VUF13980.1 hypothetical protein MTDSW087_03690 [Methylobacterium dankookense]
MTLDPEELSAAELLVARIAANTSEAAALAFSGHFLSSNFGRSLSTMEARICDGALLILARTERLSVRAQLAAILASVESGPVRTVTHLAYDLEVEVAGPLLKRSPLISEEDLEAIAQLRSQDHLTALAGRTTLSPALAGIVKSRLSIFNAHGIPGKGTSAAIRQTYSDRPAPASDAAEYRPHGSSSHSLERRRARIERMTLRLIEGGRHRCGEAAD